MTDIRTVLISKADMTINKNVISVSLNKYKKHWEELCLVKKNI